MASEQAKRQLTRMQELGLTESLAYRPKVGASRTIVAVVDRQLPAEVMHALAPGMVVTALNDATLGIVPASLDVGADSIDLAERFGGTAAARGIQAVTNQDSDWISFTVR